MANEQNNLDELLDRATEALAKTPVPMGPPEEVPVKVLAYWKSAQANE